MEFSDPSDFFMKFIDSLLSLTCKDEVDLYNSLPYILLIGAVDITIHPLLFLLLAAYFVALGIL